MCIYDPSMSKAYNGQLICTFHRHSIYNNCFI